MKNRQIETAAIIGAGAVGAYFIAGLSETMGDRFFVIAEGARRQRLLQNGITINGVHRIPNVRTSEEAGPVDLLLIATKYDALREALPTIQKMTGPGTIVLSTLNGVNSEEIVAEVIDERQLLYSFMFISSQREGNEIRFDPEITKGLVIGEKIPHFGNSERANAVKDLMDAADIRCRISQEIVREQWQKYGLNISSNLPQAILGVGYGAYIDSEHVLYLHDRLFEEVIAVAKAYGIDVAYEGCIRGRSVDSAQWSTLQDLNAHRHTEIEMFAGVLMQKARQANIPVPFTEYSYHAIKALEEKNDGKFDYKD